MSSGDERLVQPAALAEDRQDPALRPERLADFVGQRQVLGNLAVSHVLNLGLARRGLFPIRFPCVGEFTLVAFFQLEEEALLGL